MDWTRAQAWITAAVVLVGTGVLLLVGLSSFGIWDPWELAAADAARELAAGTVAIERPPMIPALIAGGFAAFGIHEWSGRLPIAIGGLAAVIVAYMIGSRFAGRRAGVWSGAITATTPLLVLNTRQMLGAAPAFAASAAVFGCACAAVFRPAALRSPRRTRRIATGLWLLGLAISAAFAILASGVLLGVAPPLLGVGAAILARRELRWPPRDPTRTLAAAIVFAAALIAGLGAAHAVWADYATFGLWTGGTPRGGNPPTWEIAIERLFHSFAPWSALLPLALARMLAGRSPGPTDALAVEHAANLRPSRPAAHLWAVEEPGLRFALVGWVAFGFAAQTVFTARYGPATFLPVVGASVATALLLLDVERSRGAHRALGIVAFLLVGLLVRDYRGYPGAPIASLAAEGVEVPADAFNPWPWWAGFFGLFGLLLAFGLFADPIRRAAILHRGPTPRDALVDWLFRDPVRLIRRQWQRGPGTIVWLVVLTLPHLGAMLFGLLCHVVPEEPLARELHTTTLAVRIGAALLFEPLAVVVLILAVRAAWFVFSSLGRWRFAPAVLAAFLAAGFTAFGFLPALSSHFSPREVYDTYNSIARRGEPLGEFRVGGRAAAYYATGPIQELETQSELIEFLRGEGRVWAVFRADDLASIDREYRRLAQRHLFVVDARSARMLLATNRPVEGVENQNYLADAVLDEVPHPEHPVLVSFDNRIELIGYDLDLPRDRYVGPGESFRITWYYRVVAPVPGSYRIFVHIDGPGERINGDHDPVEGRYPVRLWEPGDIIVDRQELRVPANYARGDLTIYMGFYAGEQRLDVVRGPADDVDRARAGYLRVR